MIPNRNETPGLVWSLLTGLTLFLPATAPTTGPFRDIGASPRPRGPRPAPGPSRPCSRASTPLDVLLDWGNWAYLPSNHLALDRAIAMGDFPTVRRYDLLEPFLQRIQARRYKKIMVHRYEPVRLLNSVRGSGIRSGPEAARGNDGEQPKT